MKNLYESIFTISNGDNAKNATYEIFKNHLIHQADTWCQSPYANPIESLDIQVKDNKCSLYLESFKGHGLYINMTEIIDMTEVIGLELSDIYISKQMNNLTLFYSRDIDLPVTIHAKDIWSIIFQSSTPENPFMLTDNHNISHLTIDAKPTNIISGSINFINCDLGYTVTLQLHPFNIDKMFTKCKIKATSLDIEYLAKNNTSYNKILSELFDNPMQDGMKPKNNMIDRIGLKNCVEGNFNLYISQGFEPRVAVVSDGTYPRIPYTDLKQIHSFKIPGYKDKLSVFI